MEEDVEQILLSYEVRGYRPKPDQIKNEYKIKCKPILIEEKTFWSIFVSLYFNSIKFDW